MKVTSTFIRTLVVVCAALAVFVVVCSDDLSELDVAGQYDMVLQWPERLPGHGLQSSLFVPLSKSTYSLSPGMDSRPPTFVPLSTFALRC
jgi:hypothetical protein